MEAEVRLLPSAPFKESRSGYHNDLYRQDVPERTQDELERTLSCGRATDCSISEVVMSGLPTQHNASFVSFVS